jgi:hypothetical protein
MAGHSHKGRREEDGGFWFGPRVDDAAAEIVRRIDAGLLERRRAEPERRHLGASRLGLACLRQLGMEYFRVPPDPGRELTGRTLRIFELGHAIEAMAAGWLELAGFTLHTRNAEGGQFAFEAAHDPEGRPRMAGHIDGVLVAGPPVMSFPALWECKSMKEKTFREVAAKGLAVAQPVYHTQVCVYMGHLALHESPALFTAVNKDTSELYFELVPFDRERAQWAIDRGVEVLRAAFPEELPRVSGDRADFRCRRCEFSERCWSEPSPSPQPPERPAWLMHAP